MLAKLGYSVIGIDPSTSGIAIAKKNASPLLRFEVGSTEDDLAGKFGTFPVVISLEVIEHCPSAREFMRSFRSLIRFPHLTLAHDAAGYITRCRSLRQRAGTTEKQVW